MRNRILLIFFSIITAVSAQESNGTLPLEMIVNDWAFYLPDYDARYHTMITETESLPEPNRSNERKKVTDEIKNDFIQKRTTEFKSKSIDKELTHSCMKSYSGGKKKKCGWINLNSPHRLLYTKPKLVKLVSGKLKKRSYAKDGSAVGMYQSKSSKGTISGTLRATFIYRPDFIKRTVNKDLGDLWRAVIARN